MKTKFVVFNWLGKSKGWGFYYRDVGRGTAAIFDSLDEAEAWLEKELEYNHDCERSHYRKYYCIKPVTWPEEEP